ncbi:hypothetical protein OBBRIDRAFT_790730 [Obba rivulosa]|uniref:Uncharacterized protein n=1 Tax=Obba rivulosa TaxID=1052685 RepID=A0A8E2DLX4_9APHY|nr:hypothetical protein OBBRIDRAFT_790730 [Obba rivulosa]
MLRAAFSQCLRSTASSSSAHSAALHTSAVRCAGQAGRLTAAQRSRKRKVKEIAASDGRPHVVLGHKPGDEAKWTKCDLAKVIITEEDIQAAPIPSPVADLRAGIETPTYYNYGVGTRERDLLFYTLPPLTTERVSRRSIMQGVISPASNFESADAKEQRKATTFARVVDLRNANARGIAYENRRRIIAAFSTPENPEDPGRPEVQAALMTLRIRNIWTHLKRCKADFMNRRNLRILVHQRAKILRYLKKKDVGRYDTILERLGLEPEAVEGELVV